MAVRSKRFIQPGSAVIRPRAGTDITPGDRAVRLVSLLGAAFPLAAVIFILAVLLINAYPSILYNGLGFFYRQAWAFGNFYGDQTVTHNGIIAPTGASYGALPFIAGTLLTSIIAFVVGVPIAIGAALMLTEKIPAVLRGRLSFFLELLAGIPSVIYGLWGLVALGPFLAAHVYPALARGLGFIPWLAGPVGSGQGLLTAGLVLAVMIIPIVASTTRDLLAQVPALPREGALALGLTPWEAARYVQAALLR